MVGHHVLTELKFIPVQYVTGTSENLSLSLSLSLSHAHTKIDLSDDITCNLFEIIQTIALKKTHTILLSLKLVNIT